MSLCFTLNCSTGQVSSKNLTCTFRASCCSARLSRAQVSALVDSSVRDRKQKGEWTRGGGGEVPAVQGSTSSPTGVGSRRKVLWNLECPVGLSQKEYVHISLKEIGRNLDGPPNGKMELVGISWPKVAQIGPSWCWLVSLGCPYEPLKGPD